MEIRPAWGTATPKVDNDQAAETALIATQETIISDVEVLVSTADALYDDEAHSVSFLIQSAHKDLIAGTELARSGYVKQAYSLWRAWFEQCLFALYFREAPLHRQAWKVSEAIGLDDNPQYRLMLHQLLSESGEKHPFSIVYQEREDRIAAALKAGLPSKRDRLIAKASRTLTLFSQGVHGTYQPASANSRKDNQDSINKHCLNALRDAAAIVRRFWVLHVLSQVDLPESYLISLREGKPMSEQVKDLELPKEFNLVTPIFQKTFGAS